MERRDFVKKTGGLLAGAAAVSVFGKLRAQNIPNPNNLCGPGCNLGGGQFSNLSPTLHKANAERSASQVTLYKQGGMTNSYAATTVSGYAAPAVANLQNYGYTEQLRIACVNWVNEYNGGVYAPLTQAQLVAAVSNLAGYGYTLTAAEISAMTGFLTNQTILNNVKASWTTVGGLYNLFAFFEAFNTWVNWQAPPPATPNGTLWIPPEWTIVQDENFNSEGTEIACGAFFLGGWWLIAAGEIIGVNDPPVGGIIAGIGAMVLGEGVICETGGYQTFGDGMFVD